MGRSKKVLEKLSVAYKFKDLEYKASSLPGLNYMTKRFVEKTRVKGGIKMYQIWRFKIVGSKVSNKMTMLW